MRRAGAERASKNFDTQAEAITYGRQLARKDASDLFVHGKSGKIRDHQTFKK